MGYVYAFASGLVLLIMGIAFLWNRILFIKKGNITLATLIKLEVGLDSEDNKYYTPYFTFTTHNNKEITYEHTRTDWKHKWTLGQQVKVAYREGYFDDHEILLLTFLHTFGLSLILLTLGFILLFVAGGVYWNVSVKTLGYLIPASISVFIAAIYCWSNRFYHSLNHI
jgi:hypothetical protein